MMLIHEELMENYGNTYLNQIDIIIFEITNYSSLNCNQIFALFLIYIFRFVSLRFFKDLVFFVVCFRIMLNEEGWDKCKDINDGFFFDTTKEFC